MRTLIGGVGYRWRRDGSFGLILADDLARLDWPAGMEIADLGYGALYVAQDLADAAPPYDRLILLAGVTREREPGSLHHYRPDRILPSDDEILARVREAGAGVIDVDHLLVIAGHLGALPPEVVVVELEPVLEEPGVDLSPEARQVLPRATDLVRQLAEAPVVERTAGVESGASRT
jgi:hydrogenase maturation protease